MTKFTNKQADEIILGTLRDIATGYVRPHETRYGKKMCVTTYGICDHVASRIIALYLWTAQECAASGGEYQRTMRRLCQLMQRWPEHSGSRLYPVPSFRPDMSAKEAFEMHSHNLWDKRTAYGKARWRLLSWLVRRLEGEA